MRSDHRFPSRRAVAWLTTLVAVACACGPSSPDASDPAHPGDGPEATASESAVRNAPDVVIIVIDTTRADRLGMYGHDRPTSPHLDRLAEESVVFERAWSTASWTLPSHASLLTGQYPTAHGARMSEFTDSDSNGANPAFLHQGATTLAELLTERGYRTAAYSGAGWLSPEFGLMQGYEVQDAENNRDIEAEVITDRALAWVDGLGDDEPMHLLVNYFDAHWPYTPVPPHDRFAKQWPNVRILSLGDIFAGKKPTPQQAEKMLALYDGEIEYMDLHIGRLLDGLRAAGRYDDTMFVVIADHGELFGEHGDLGHGAWLWEELLRIPLIVRYPGGRDGGKRETAMASTVDVLTWIAQEVGLELPDDVDGLAVGERNLVMAEEFPSALFKKQGVDRDLVAGVQWPWKLIAASDGTHELFRIEQDPGELAAVEDEGRTGEIQSAIESVRSTLVEPELDRTRTMSPEAAERLRELGYIE